MKAARAHGSLASLPDTLPIFPLTGALLLPEGRLPLTIFEPRYINMIDDALGHERLIGMIQPIEQEGLGPTPPVFRLGCAGRIISFAEESERYLITLEGVARFDVLSDEVTVRDYRLARVDWSPYAGDLNVGDLTPGSSKVDRPRLVAGIKAYFQQRELSADWNAIEAVPIDRLVTTLAMVCPFDPDEKQALLQARNLEERAKVLIGLVESALYPQTDGRTN